MQMRNMFVNFVLILGFCKHVELCLAVIGKRGIDVDQLIEEEAKRLLSDNLVQIAIEESVLLVHFESSMSIITVDRVCSCIAYRTRHQCICLKIAQYYLEKNSSCFSFNEASVLYQSEFVANCAEVVCDNESTEFHDTEASAYSEFRESIEEQLLSSVNDQHPVKRLEKLLEWAKSDDFRDTKIFRQRLSDLETLAYGQFKNKYRARKIQPNEPHRKLIAQAKKRSSDEHNYRCPSYSKKKRLAKHSGDVKGQFLRKKGSLTISSKSRAQNMKDVLHTNAIPPSDGTDD